MDYRTLDPSTGELVERYPTVTGSRIDAALTRSERAFSDWRRRPLSERTALLENLATLLEARAAPLAETMALEMGKPLAEGEAETRKCAWVCRWYAENAERYLAPERVESDGSEAWVRFEPLGPIFAVMPWNFPLWQVFRHAAPAFAAGNTVILKHAPGTPRCALAIEALVREAGAPDGLLENLFLSDEDAARVVRDSAVRGVTLTGSTRAGREVGRVAGEALRPLVLELGGSDPFVVFADADLESAVATGIASRCLNGGQSCIAAKRFVVERPIYESFREAFVAGMQERTAGDPRNRDHDLGPMARGDLRTTLHEQVGRLREAGAAVHLGGTLPPGSGYLYPPTVLDGVSPDAPAAREELFGPVAVLFPFESESRALEIANATDYGLGASVWTEDRERARRCAIEIEAGSVFVNGMVKSDPRLPFGGVRCSGFGRELGREGIRSFVNVKTIWWA